MNALPPIPSFSSSDGRTVVTTDAESLEMAWRNAEILLAALDSVEGPFSINDGSSASGALCWSATLHDGTHIDVDHQQVTADDDLGWVRCAIRDRSRTTYGTAITSCVPKDVDASLGADAIARYAIALVAAAARQATVDDREEEPWTIGAAATLAVADLVGEGSATLPTMLFLRPASPMKPATLAALLDPDGRRELFPADASIAPHMPMRLRRNGGEDDRWIDLQTSFAAVEIDPIDAMARLRLMRLAEHEARTEGASS